MLNQSTTYCLVAGCTDPTASNYDPNACIDDGSCGIYIDHRHNMFRFTDYELTGVTNIIHNRATFTFDDMNSSTCNYEV